MQTPARSQAAWQALTRLQPLQSREDVIPRPDLPGALCAAVTSHALTLVSAPAGYGKSTLLAGLVSAQPACRWATCTRPTSRRPAMWARCRMA